MMMGCGNSGYVQAVAPGGTRDMAGVAPHAGSYTLFRATGTIANQEPRLEPVWTVRLSRGQPLGFDWLADPSKKWTPGEGFRLEARAGAQTRDLGPVTERDLKFFWAESEGDAVGYVHQTWRRETFDTLTMR